MNVNREWAKAIASWWLLLSAVLVSATRLVLGPISTEPKIVLYGGIVIAAAYCVVVIRRVQVDSTLSLIWTAYLFTLGIPLLRYDANVSDWKVYFVYVVTFFVILIIPTLFSSGGFVDWFLDRLILVATLVALLGIGIYFRVGLAIDIGLIFQPLEIYYPDRPRPRRGHSLYISPSAFGGWLLLVVFFGIIKSIAADGRQKYMYSFGTIIIAFAIILTNTRGVVGAFAVGLGVFTTTYFISKNQTKFAWAFIKRGLISGVAGALLLSFGVLPEFNAISRLTGILEGDHLASVAIRIEIWKDGIEMFLSAPFFGVGLDRYGEYVSTADRFAANPHNVFVQWLAETGSVSTFIVLTAIFVCVRPAISSILGETESFQTQYSIALIGTLAAFFAENFFGSSIRYAAPLLLFWVLLAMTRVLHNSEQVYPE
jgi:O-antigen ligase